MPIRIRLTLWYVALLGTVLIVFSATFYWVLQFSLTTEIDLTLEDRAGQVARGIQAQNDPRNIVESGMISLPELDVFSSRSIYIQIVDPNGAVKKISPNLGDYTLPIDEQILADIAQGQPSLITYPIGPINMRLYSVPLIFGENIIGMVQVGQPLNGVETTLKRVLLFLIVGTVLALIVATLSGIFMARLTLQPIDRIVSTARQIVSAQDLGERLPVSGANDELDRLSQTFNNMLARLDKFFQSQVRLSADISHELRTPLTIIRGNIHLLSQGGETPDEREEAVQAITSALDRMSRLVSDLLLLSQADAGMTLTMRELELDEVILDVFQQVHTLSNGVNLQLGNADHAIVYGDSDRLKQLLINLMDNAIKHTPEGGCVTLSVFREPVWVRVSVADTGAGISPEHLPHIFDRFYRIKGQKQKGFGLGLPIARWIAEAHNGTLTTESKPGIGSTFILKLPLANDNQAPNDDQNP